jgi:hypothetical protein
MWNYVAKNPKSVFKISACYFQKRLPYLDSGIHDPITYVTMSDFFSFI